MGASDEESDGSTRPTSLTQVARVGISQPIMYLVVVRRTDRSHSSSVTCSRTGCFDRCHQHRTKCDSDSGQRPTDAEIKFFRETADQSDRTAGGRLLCQPAPATPSGPRPGTVTAWVGSGR